MNSHFLRIMSLAAFAGMLAFSQNNTRYLALGDSLPFGFNPLIQPPALSKFAGYPLLVGEFLHRKLANASCIGETSTSFITGLAMDDLGVLIPSEGCQNYKAAHPLFVSYTGSQLNYAVSYLKSNPKTQLVTINIGGNDLAFLQYQCSVNPACNPAPTFAKYASNLSVIFSRIRGEAGYQGPIVLLTYYAFDYTNAVQAGAIALLNQTATTVAGLYNVTIADGFTAFAIVSGPFAGKPCDAGLLIKLPNGACDTHPTLLGQAVLGAAVVAATPRNGHNSNGNNSDDNDHEN